MSKSLGIGSTLGQYRIDALLGQGGMGVVYRAFDTKLNRPVAVKFLSAEVADADARRRFQREAQMASSLNHPHIVTVHDAGDWEGEQYVVTEFLDGGTLSSWAAAEPRTWRQCVELIAGVADGLATAHEAHILHRDIKPANILVSTEWLREARRLWPCQTRRQCRCGRPAHAQAWLWERLLTCPRSKPSAANATRAAISSLWAWCFTKCCRESVRSMARLRRISFSRSSNVNRLHSMIRFRRRYEISWTKLWRRNRQTVINRRVRWRWIYAGSRAAWSLARMLPV